MRKKKLLSLLLVMALVLTTVIVPSGSVFAAESGGQMKAQAAAAKSGTFKYAKEFKWTLDSEGTLKVTGKGSLYFSLEDVFSVRGDIKKISIGSGATDITFDLQYYQGVSGLPNLKSLSLPSTLKSITNSLAACENLETVTGGKNVEEIIGGVFEGTKWIKGSEIVTLGKVLVAYNGKESTLTIPSGIVVVGDSALAYNETVKTVSIPSSVKTIGDSAFYKSAVSKISGGENVTKVGSSALSGTPWLTGLTKTTKLGKVLIKYKGTGTSYTVPTSVTQIYDGAFSGASKLKTVTVKAKVTEIPAYAFENCKSLTKITLPSTVTNIAYGAFDHCSALPSITLPSSLKTIGTGAFIFCESLSKVTVNKGANNTKLNSLGTAAFGGCKSLKTLTIPKKASVDNFAYGYDFDTPETYGLTKPVKLSNVSISGVKNTEAQTYAKKNGITFKSVADNGDNGSSSGGGNGVFENSGTVVKAAEKKKNGLTAPGISVGIEYDGGTRIQLVQLSAVTGARGYQIWYSSTGKSGSWKKLASYTNVNNIYGIERSTTCYYKARAYKKVNGKIVYGPYSKTMKIK